VLGNALKLKQTNGSLGREEESGRMVKIEGSGAGDAAVVLLPLVLPVSSGLKWRGDKSRSGLGAAARKSINLLLGQNFKREKGTDGWGPGWTRLGTRP
jgi:hypothetical protein